MFVMPHAWDEESAQRFQATGFAALSTTSGGVAEALGFADHQCAPVDAMIEAAGRIVRSVSIPVTVDLEGGYGLSADEIAKRLVEIGAVGLNLEDTSYQPGPRLVPAEQHAEWLASVKSAGRSRGVDLFLNARVDVFLRGEGDFADQVAEGVRRARLYRAAGADCVYPILLSDVDAIRQIVVAAGVVNITARLNGPPSLEAVAAAGVRRVTYATGLYRDIMGYLDRVSLGVPPLT
jgi:2-methylisocitrate lyase-like PEP mutase family enzyme